ncbi:MAG: glycosyltransferase [Planctomycetes bacterium]|nr:glycosyltransferase [Planctomycetota bacterium]
MKILVLAHGFPPDQMAGAEIYAAKTARGLARLGHDLVVFAPGQRPEAGPFGLVEEDLDGLRVIRMHNDYRDIHRLADTYDRPAINDRLREVFARERPDLVHVHHVIGTGGAAIPLARAAGARVVVTLHDFWFHCARGQRITPRQHLCTEVELWRCALCLQKKRLRYAFDWTRAELGGHGHAHPPEGAGTRLLKLLPRGLHYGWRELGLGPLRRRLDFMESRLAEADLVLAPARFLMERFIERGLDPGRCEFWPYGLDEGQLGDAGREPAPTPAVLRFGFVGTLIPNKGPDLVVKAFAGIEGSRATMAMHGAGAGPNARRYENRLHRLNRNPALRFHGRFDNREIARILGELDVLVVPSRWWENAPLTLAESVMARLAAITADQGGMRELAERFGNAITFAANSVDSLRAAILRLIDDHALVDRLKRAGHGVRRLDDDVRALSSRFESLLAAPRQESGL